MRRQSRNGVAGRTSAPQSLRPAAPVRAAVRTACEPLERRLFLSVAAVDDHLTTPAGTPLPIAPSDLLGNDAGLTSVTGVGQPQHGTVIPAAGGGYTYTPDPGYAGPDQFTYAAAGEAGVPGNVLALPTIPGDTARGGQVRLLSYSFGIARSATVPTGGGATAGKAVFDQLVVQADMGSASPGFLAALSLGRPVGTAAHPITLTTRDAANHLVAAWSFSNVFVTGYAAADDAAAAGPVETITFTVGSAALSVARLDAGGATTTPVTGTWDAVRNSGTVDPIEAGPPLAAAGLRQAADPAWAGARVAAAPSQSAAVAAPVRVVRLGPGLDVPVDSAAGGAGMPVTFDGTAVGATVGKASLDAFTFSGRLEPTAPRLFGSVATGRTIAPAVTYSVRDAQGRAATTWTLGDPTATGGSAVVADSLTFSADAFGMVTETFGLRATAFAQAASDAGSATPAASAAVDVVTGPNSSARIDFGGAAGPTGPGVVSLELFPSRGGDRGGSLQPASYAFGAESAAAIGSGAAGTGASKVSLHDLTITIPAGAASAGFVDMLATGRRLDRATLTVRDADGVVRRSITVEDVYVTDYAVGDDGDPDPAARPTATVGLTFRAATDTYAPPAAAPTAARVDPTRLADQYGGLVAGGDDAGSDYRLYLLAGGTPTTGGTLPANTPYVDVATAAWGSTSAAAGGSGSGGTSAGKLTFDTFSFTAAANRQSPGLLGTLATGGHFARAILYQRRNGGSPASAWTMGQVFVTGYETTGGSGDGPETDHVEMAFGGMSVRTYDAGGGGGSVSRPPVQWDQVTNRPGGLEDYEPPASAAGFAAAGFAAAAAPSVADAGPGSTLHLAADAGGVTDDADLDLLDYAFSTANPVSIGSGTTGVGVGVGKATFGELTVTRRFDEYSPTFLGLQGRGTVLPTLALATADATGKPYATFTLGGVVVSGYGIEYEDGDGPVETIRFAYRSLTEAFTSYDPAGNPRPVVAASFDRVADVGSGSGLVAGSDLGDDPPAGVLSFGPNMDVEVLAAAWAGGTNPVVLGSGQQVGMPDLGTFTFTVRFNRESPGVFRALTSGGRLPAATYTSRDAAGHAQTWRVGGDAGGPGFVYATSDAIAAGGDGEVVETFRLVGTPVLSAYAAQAGPATGYEYDPVRGQPTARYPSAADFGGAVIAPTVPTATGTVFVDVLPPVPPPPPPNAAPTDVALAPAAVAENAPAGTVVGTLSAADADAGAGDTATFALVAGPGADDNAAFSIDAVAGTVRVLAAPDFEAKPLYRVRVRATDGGGLSFERPLTVTVTDVNEAPTDLRLTAAGPLPDDSRAGTVVGTLSATDPDAGDAAAFALLDSAGGRFAVVGNQIRVADPARLDALANPTLTLTVRATDRGGLSVVRQVAVTLSHVNRPPVLTAPASLTGFEGSPVAVTGLAVSDPDAGPRPLRVTLRAGAGTLAVRTGVAGGVPADGVVGNNAGTVVLTGSAAQLNATFAAVGGVTLNAPPQFAGATTVTVTADDLGGGGPGPGLTDTEVVSVGIRSAAAQAAAIQDAVQVLVAKGTLAAGPATALTATLKNLGTGPSAAAKVAVYLVKVAEYVLTRKLTAADAAPLAAAGLRLALAVL